MQKLKEKIKELLEFWDLWLFNGIREWRASADIPGIREVEKQMILHYLFKYSHFYIRKEMKEWDEYPRDNFCYGETLYSTARIMADTVGINEKDVVYDLGCGRGKFLFFINVYTHARCIGVDLLPTYINTAEQIVNKLKLSRINFYVEDMMNVDLYTATVVLIHGTCFGKEFHKQLADKTLRMKSGGRVISVSFPYYEEHLKLTEKKYLRFSWGESPVYFYTVHKD